MQLNKIFEKITYNWKPKIVCVAASILLIWFHNMASVDTKSFVVPLQVKSNGDTSISSGLERYKNVKVEVRLDKSENVTITDRDFNAWVDVSNFTKNGRYSLPVFVDIDKRLLTLDSIEVKAKPEFISVELDEKVFADVPLSATLRGNCDFGYETGVVTVDPAVIRVYGPEKLVRSLSFIQTDSIVIDGLSQTKSFDTSPVNISQLISLDTTKPVKVTVNVRESVSSMDMVDVEVSVKNLAENLTLESPLQKVALKLEGNTLKMQNVSSKNVTAHVDCSDIKEPGAYEVPVQVSVPDGFRLGSQSEVSVVLNVVEKKTEVENDVPPDTEAAEKTEVAPEKPVEAAQEDSEQTEEAKE